MSGTAIFMTNFPQSPYGLLSGPSKASNRPIFVHTQTNALMIDSEFIRKRSSNRKSEEKRGFFPQLDFFNVTSNDNQKTASSC